MYFLYTARFFSFQYVHTRLVRYMHVLEGEVDDDVVMSRHQEGGIPIVDEDA